jgi:hypothetical protein
MSQVQTEREKVMQYAVEMKRTNYYTIFIDADTEDQAEMRARQSVDADFYDDGDEWTVESIEKVSKS